MSRGINRVTLIGNLGNDPDVRYTQGGMAVTKVSLATTSVRKDRDGNQQEKTEWHRVAFFGKSAEIVGEYAKKGSPLYVEGRISYSESTGDDGVKRYYTDIIGDQFQFLGGGRGEGDSRQSGGSGRSTSESGRSGGGQKSAPPPPPQDDFVDDSDIPF